MLFFILQGRFPFYLEPAMIICITDGRKLTTQGTVQNEVLTFYGFYGPFHVIDQIKIITDKTVAFSGLYIKGSSQQYL